VSLDQPRDTRTKLLLDASHLLDRLALRIIDRPVIALEARNERAGISAAHRDEKAGASRDLVREQARRRPDRHAIAPGNFSTPCDGGKRLNRRAIACPDGR